MSEENVRATFHKFCKNCAEYLYDEHVYLPTGAAQENTMDAFRRRGFTGAIGSTDVTRIRWDGCPSSLAHSHKDETGFPSIAYQATVDCSGRVIAVTRGVGGATSDNTIMRYDPAVQRIREDPEYKDRMFRLRNEDGTWNEHKGNYVLVGNGFHDVRSVFCCPFLFVCLYASGADDEYCCLGIAVYDHFVLRVCFFYVSV